jgi:hypothetical protein
LRLTKNTLIIPVHLEGLQPELTLGSVRLVRKKEHHLTVFGFPAGKVLKRAFAADAGLSARIDELAASFDWAIELVPRLYHLSRTKPEGGTLQTVIVRANARVDAFYEQVRALGSALDELQALLAAPPPPHITLYTTDAEGLAGIGLNTGAELDEAIARGAAGDTTGLAAYPLAPGVAPKPHLKEPR